MNLNLKIVLRAVKIRMSRGEELEVILNSYPKLSLSEREEIRNALQQEI